MAEEESSELSSDCASIPKRCLLSLHLPCPCIPSSTLSVLASTHLQVKWLHRVCSHSPSVTGITQQAQGWDVASGGKATHPLIHFAPCSLLTQPVLAKLMAMSLSFCLLFRGPWAPEKCSRFLTHMPYSEVYDNKPVAVLVERAEVQTIWSMGVLLKN